MTTAAFEAVASIPKRIEELELLILTAKGCAETNEQLYNTLCRACCVLLASHLEGFLKDLTSGLLADLNYHLKGFHEMPEAMKRTFAKKIAFYDGVEAKEIEKRIAQLVSFFDKNSVQIDLDYFSYKENPNKNPNSSFIDTMFERFGINCIVNSIATPSFEVVFDNYEFTNFVIKRDMRKRRSSLYRFPYTAIGSKYQFARIKKGKSTETLWHSYIEEIMTRRHSIAHGDVTGNDTTWEELKIDVQKMHVLMHGLAFSAADFLRK
ncbi:HEPN domain-containing protein [Devosia sp. Leaf64]|uniref:MAE_28990/MAE_18760 family HEPN-like nuclease n=1 Tax=Devosia sp. Leaf64 TaxID=1736229 RepID=UPI0007124FC0|nr:HEPN domain-containing protein [Devosia sp. Leaf64]KQN72188.1 hypothetical protein ASE94_06570 [Devosia sp. Leaf64]